MLTGLQISKSARRTRDQRGSTSYSRSCICPPIYPRQHGSRTSGHSPADGATVALLPMGRYSPNPRLRGDLRSRRFVDPPGDGPWRIQLTAPPPAWLSARHPQFITQRQASSHLKPTAGASVQRPCTTRGMHPAPSDSLPPQRLRLRKRGINRMTVYIWTPAF